MKKSVKFLSIVFSLLMIFTMLSPALAQVNPNTVTYDISNPYSDIDWNTINTCKTALHTHTNASDGDNTLKEMLERHGETGFDIVAITDHGTVDYGWDEPKPNSLIYPVMRLIGKSENGLVGLGKSGTFDNGTVYTYSTNENGDDILTYEDRPIMRVPFGIENNAVSVNAHVNSFFCDYHNNFVTTYIDAVRGVHKKGGISIINHPGEYSKARYELTSAGAYDENVFAYRYLINKWANLLNKYDSCLGVDVNSKGDDRTRFDRILWDKLLIRFSANGENVFGFCTSDAHQLDKVDSGFIYALMPSLSNKALRTSLENGEFFGASPCIGNYDELVQIANALKEYYGETELYDSVNAVAQSLEKRIADIQNGVLDADEKLSDVYRVLDKDGYCSADTQPMITKITVDDIADTIKIDTENALLVRWISNGKLITTQNATIEETFSLAEFEDEIGNYVRAEVFGEGGIVYTQAFILNAEQNAGKQKPVDKDYIDFGFFDFMFSIIHNWKDIISRM